jgi:hypothetical protein
MADVQFYKSLSDDELDRELLRPDVPPMALDERLERDMADLAEEPLEWVKYSYPWGEGPLSGFDGPDTWQQGFLREWGEEIRLRAFDGVNAVMPYFATTTSGHGVGKSALVGWISGFILSTRPMSKGRVTANSLPQLQTTTWAEIIKWKELMATGHWFRATSGRGAMKVEHRVFPTQWRIDGIAWDKDRPAAFAGLHAASSSPWYIVDEASEVARVIMETAQGALTDGEPFFFMFSNPTAASGYFFDSHHDMAHRFKTYKIDSRTARMTNKKLIAQWIEDWGIDSDFVKVRVLGEFPLTGNRQLIPTNLINAAANAEREPVCVPTDPVIIGVDVARYGGDESTVYVRRGRDGRSIPPRIFRNMDNFQLALEVKKLAEELLADAINIDSGYGTGVIDTLRNLGVPNVNEVHFGSTIVPDREAANMATYMMLECRKWLKQANVTIPVDPILKRQLAAREYDLIEGTKGTQIRAVSKETMRKEAVGEDREDHSPDRADGFCLTFAVIVPFRDVQRTKAMMTGQGYSSVVGVDYDR